MLTYLLPILIRVTILREFFIEREVDKTAPSLSFPLFGCSYLGPLELTGYRAVCATVCCLLIPCVCMLSSLVLHRLGGERLLEAGEGDELCGQEESFQDWLKRCYLVRNSLHRNGVRDYPARNFPL